jgi:hypothetical protein
MPNLVMEEEDPRILDVRNTYPKEDQMEVMVEEEVM